MYNKPVSVLRASYSTTQGIRGGPLVIHIRPMHVLTQSTLPIEQGSTITLWSQKGCMCTRMKEGREYLILGYEDVAHNRLLFDSRTMVVPWKDSWESKITVCHGNRKGVKLRGGNLGINRIEVYGVSN